MSSKPSAAAVYRRLLGYARPHWRVFALGLLGMLVFAATDPLLAALFQPMIDGSLIRKDADTIRLVPLLLIGLFIVRGVASFTATYYIQWVGRKVIQQLRSELLAHLLRLPAPFYDRATGGELLSRLLYDTEQVANATTQAVTTVVRDTFSVILLMTYLLWLHSTLALLFLLVGPVIAVTVRYMSLRLRRLSRSVQDSMAQLGHRAREAIDGQRSVKAYGGAAWEQAAFERENARNQAQVMKFVLTEATGVPLVQLFTASGLALVVYLASLESLHNNITPGTFISFIGAMAMLLTPMKRLVGVNGQIQRGIAAGQSLFALLDLPPESDTGHQMTTRARGELRFEAVSLSYPGQTQPALTQLDLLIPAGQTVALVGRSGSGKSSVLALLLRFYAPTAGIVRLDGMLLADWPLAALRQQIAWVSQSVNLFNATIADNIAYGELRGKSRAEIEAAARAAHAWEFISQLPQGLDTWVGEDGNLFSGGQRQRLALARAFLKDAPILLLDEATSALDSESERLVQEALGRLMAGRTTLIIAHRLSTIERAERIIVLDQGQIVEEGTHAALLAQGGAYAAFYHQHP